MLFLTILGHFPRVCASPREAVMPRQVGSTHVVFSVLDASDIAATSRGRLKRSPFCNKKHGFFNTKTKGSHNLQGNVQVYNVRIPVQVSHNPNPGR